MTITDLLSIAIPVLSPETTASEALARMEELHFPQLPVVHEGVFLGLVRESQLLDVYPEDTPIGSELPICKTCTVSQDQHPLDVLKVADEFHSLVVGVVDERRQYIGTIAVQDVAFMIGRQYGVAQSGSTLVLSILMRDYSLAEIARLVESNGVKILTVLTEVSADDPTHILVILRLGTVEYGRVVATLERFGYLVVARYGTSLLPDIDRERLDSFMHYLSV
jgi:acetoin utilization protein AcuB